MFKKEEVKPLAPAGAALDQTTTTNGGGINGDVEIAQHKLGNQRRRILLCCGCCGATVVVLGLVVLVLALTVFKVKDPAMTMNSVTIDDIEMGAATQEDSLISVNATLTVDFSIKNPNAASFRFRNSTTELYYRGETVAVAYVPSGTAAAHGTVRMNATLDVLADRVMAVQPNLTSSILSANGVSLDLRSFTEVSGRVSVWGIYKRDIDVKLNCTMTLEYVLFTRREIKNKVCGAIVK